jgi:FtsZ-interacting cell division protein ZipA
MNSWILLAVGIAVISLIIFLLWQNRKDRKKFEQQLNRDYPKSKDEENDAETEERQS